MTSKNLHNLIPELDKIDLSESGYIIDLKSVKKKITQLPELIADYIRNHDIGAEVAQSLQNVTANTLISFLGTYIPNKIHGIDILFDTDAMIPFAASLTLYDGIKDGNLVEALGAASVYLAKVGLDVINYVTTGNIEPLAADAVYGFSGLLIAGTAGEIKERF